MCCNQQRHEDATEYDRTPRNSHVRQSRLPVETLRASRTTRRQRSDLVVPRRTHSSASSHANQQQFHVTFACQIGRRRACISTLDASNAVSMHVVTRCFHVSQPIINQFLLSYLVVFSSSMIELCPRSSRCADSTVIGTKTKTPQIIAIKRLVLPNFVN